MRIGNWVEEQYSREAAEIKATKGDTLKDFIKALEAHQTSVAKSKDEARNTKRIEPKMGEPAFMLFSHGPTFNEKFSAAMSSLHYTDPASREYGAASNDRAHKSFFYGSKHIDQYVPKVNPNPRLALMSTKQEQWVSQSGQKIPYEPSMYDSVSKLAFAK